MAHGRSRKGPSADFLWGLLDLWTVVILVALSNVFLFLLGPEATPVVTLLLVILFLFFLPGYACIAALQPRHPHRNRFEERDGVLELEQYESTVNTEAGMVLAERLILGAGMSVGITAATGFALHATGIGIEPEPAATILSAITLGGCVIAATRRYQLPPDTRFDGRVALDSLVSIRGLFIRRSATDMAITSVIVVSLVVAVAGIAFIAVSVDDRESHTELYVLAANDSDEPVAAEYPADEEGTDELLLGVENRENRPMNYTLVVQRQRIDGEEVVRSEEVDRYRLELSADGAWRTTYQVPTADEENFAGERLLFLLYVDTPPDDPDRENAYRAVHVWLDATDAD